MREKLQRAILGRGGGGATSTLPGTEEPSVIIQKTKGGKDKIPMQGAEFSFLFEAKAKAEDGEKISRQSREEVLKENLVY